jgi:hypothetical protein
MVRVGEITKPSRRLNVVAADPADNAVLEAAVAGKAQVIIRLRFRIRNLAVSTSVLRVVGRRGLRDVGTPPPSLTLSAPPMR